MSRSLATVDGRNLLADGLLSHVFIRTVGVDSFPAGGRSTVGPTISMFF